MASRHCQICRRCTRVRQSRTFADNCYVAACICSCIDVLIYSAAQLQECLISSLTYVLAGVFLWQTTTIRTWSRTTLRSRRWTPTCTTSWWNMSTWVYERWPTALPVDRSSRPFASTSRSGYCSELRVVFIRPGPTSARCSGHAGFDEAAVARTARRGRVPGRRACDVYRTWVKPSGCFTGSVAPPRADDGEPIDRQLQAVLFQYNYILLVVIYTSWRNYSVFV